MSSSDQTDPTIHTEILHRLSRIEEEEGIRIFYACESGSRAWGFPSRDSDYDVRFLYLRPLDWEDFYLLRTAVGQAASSLA